MKWTKIKMDGFYRVICPTDHNFFIVSDDLESDVWTLWYKVERVLTTTSLRDCKKHARWMFKQMNQ